MSLQRLLIISSISIIDPEQGNTRLEVNIEVESAKFILDSNYTIKCKTNFSAAIGWTFNGGVLPANVIQGRYHGMSSSLDILYANEKNDGYYACLATSRGGAYHGTDVVHVEVCGLSISVI